MAEVIIEVELPDEASAEITRNSRPTTTIELPVEVNNHSITISRRRPRFPIAKDLIKNEVFWCLGTLLIQYVFYHRACK